MLTETLLNQRELVALTGAACVIIVPWLAGLIYFGYKLIKDA